VHASSWRKAGGTSSPSGRTNAQSAPAGSLLSCGEIAAALEDVELTREQTEDFYTYLAERSIDLLEGSSTSSRRAGSQRSLRTRRRRRRSST
jgi:Sigma-70 factor, region 1.1